MNNKKLRKMIKKKLPWEVIHREVFMQLCQFYCENAPTEDVCSFVNKMNKITQDEILGVKIHSTEEHMEIYSELRHFYQDNADPAEYAESRKLMLRYIERLDAQVSFETSKCAGPMN